MNSMRKPQTDEVARGPGTGESMAVRDFIQGTPGVSGSLLCYLGQEFQYFERFSYLRLCSSVRYRESEHNQRLFQISAEELPELP